MHARWATAFTGLSKQRIGPVSSKHHTRSDSSDVGGRVCERVTLQPELSSQIFLWEQGVVKSSSKFKNDCIPVHCGVRAVL